MNEISVSGITLRDSNVVHESAREVFRCPFGSVPAGTSVQIRLLVTDISYLSAYLVVHTENGQSDHPMSPDTEVNGGSFLQTTFAVPEYPCVIWYWFRIELCDGTQIYYGAEAGDNAGVGKIFLHPPTAFQLTIYDRDFVTPDWVKSSVMYQIFPDRFRRSTKNRVLGGMTYHHGIGRTDMRLHENWNELPDYLPSEGHDHYMPLDLFGGDLPGITESIPYLKELGVKLLYLNPIFESYSNHRYNTADYRKIDPALGTDEDFTGLVNAAEEAGIKIILDGVFSHTGDDSIYFNKYGRYGGKGAYNSKDSVYYDWYSFSTFPDAYRSWWGFDTLPEVDESKQGWIDYIIESPNSVFAEWIRRGAAGYRLDVADELPDDTIERMRRALKAADKDAFLLGEVWEDATTKQSYNIGRRYALGAGLDSVMNYPFAKSTIDFLLGRTDAFVYRRFLVSQCQNYPKEMYFSLMNLISSHDIARAVTTLATGADGKSMSREQQATMDISSEERARGNKLLRCAAALQYALPGIPSIYYGDEIGMHGLLDPFNRGTFSGQDLIAAARGDAKNEIRNATEDIGAEGAATADTKASGVANDPVEMGDDRRVILNWYLALGALRRSRRALRTGDVLFYPTNGEVIGILRYCFGRTDAFGAPAADEAILTVVNPSFAPRRVVVDLCAEKSCITEQKWKRLSGAAWREAKCLLSSDAGHVKRCDEKNAVISGGLLDIVVPPRSAEIYDLEWDL